MIEIPSKNGGARHPRGKTDRVALETNVIYAITDPGGVANVTGFLAAL
jgi:hypothetical protein